MVMACVCECLRPQSGAAQMLFCLILFNSFLSSLIFFPRFILFNSVLSSFNLFPHLFPTSCFILLHSFLSSCNLFLNIFSTFYFVSFFSILLIFFLYLFRILFCLILFLVLLIFFPCFLYLDVSVLVYFHNFKHRFLFFNSAHLSDI